MPLPVLPQTPIPHLSLSAAGLVALADLQTIAHRTALTGTSSWFDALVLAPGLHYQQAADGVAGETSVTAEPAAGASGSGPGILAAETGPGGAKGLRITNPGMLLFLSRLGVQEEKIQERELRKRRRTGGVEAAAVGGEKRVIVLDVGAQGKGRKRRGRAFDDDDGDWELERASHLLYLASPLLTTGAVVIMVLLADWWGLAAITALMTSRLLNIYIIKGRTPPPPPPPPTPRAQLSEYTVPLSPTLSVRLRGLSGDLSALTTESWLRSKTAAQGYLEAAAKLAVYVVAIFSGNVSQAGNLVLLVLLLGSAGLLGLSNGFVKGVKAKGRVARVWDGETGVKINMMAGRGGGDDGRRTKTSVVDFNAFVQGRPPSEGDGEIGGSDGSEWGGHVGTAARDPHPVDASVDYA
ncbi:hypothetical protein C8035_v005773 [Colletotrichum spinosum]|uniref:Uncharacterized protein n=1 Tax=Colletotrichum spinosum TaxID=1347390 RepID=A0A4R8QIA8_9PEZI|nr:hypothetical protein C8035_v005773 [Colletotrichum spinosum]